MLIHRFDWNVNHIRIPVSYTHLAIGYEGDMEDGILYVRNHRKQVGILPVVKQIDTLAAEYLSLIHI